jgi:hypothetical protein
VGRFRQNLLDALDLHECREELADLVGQGRAAVDILLQAEPFTTSESRGEFLG